MRLAREHVPVIAGKTAAMLENAWTAIRDSEHTKEIARTGQQAGEAAWRRLKTEVEKYPELASAIARVSEKAQDVLAEQMKRYPAIENGWNQVCAAVSQHLEPARKPARRRKPAAKKPVRKRKIVLKPPAKKKAARKKAAKKPATRKTTTKKTATKKPATKKAGA